MRATAWFLWVLAVGEFALAAALVVQACSKTGLKLWLCCLAAGVVLTVGLEAWQAAGEYFARLSRGELFETER